MEKLNSQRWPHIAGEASVVMIMMKIIIYNKNSNLLVTNKNYLT